MSERKHGIAERVLGVGLAVSLGIVGVSGCAQMSEQSGTETPPVTEAGDPFFEPEIKYDGQGHAEVQLANGFFEYKARYHCMGQILVGRLEGNLSQIYPFPGCDNGILEPGELEKIYTTVTTSSVPR